MFVSSLGSSNPCPEKLLTLLTNHIQTVAEILQGKFQTFPGSFVLVLTRSKVTQEVTPILLPA